MVKSMFAAVAGLQAHQAKMDVIGNNIANVNTYGFKKARAVFKDQFYATMTAASGATESYGGGNPSQLGYGSQVSGVDINFGRGGIAATGTATDVYITGNGFFMVGEMRIEGYSPTSHVPEGSDLNSPTALNLTRVGDFYIDENGSLVNGNKKYVYGFKNYGEIGKDPIYTKPDDGNAADGDRSRVLETLQVPNIVMDKEGQPVKDATGNFIIAKDDTTLTEGQYIAPMKLYNLAIGEDGTVSGINDLKQNVVIGKVAVANVPNPNALEAVGESEYRAGDNTGVITGEMAGQGGTGLLASSRLEMSNVDLSQEFAEMITTQRGFQANTRIITVTDEMLQELVSMKR